MQLISLRRTSVAGSRRSSGITSQPPGGIRAGLTSSAHWEIAPCIASTWPRPRLSIRTCSSGYSTPATVGMDELQKLVSLLPDRVRSVLEAHPDLPKLVEVVMDLGRPPLARFPEGDVQLSSNLVTSDDLEQAVEQVGDFSGDNRAGIDGTLHRISCMRNRAGRIVGLTCRVGRVIEGSAAMIEDFIKGSRSILLLGRPGVGKTTAIRDISVMLANKMRKRTVIVDTSNEIGGDGDIPHPGIGDARRMQVAQPEEQHRVMQEAVENHMPQVIIIDEIGTEAECMAARTISQRGLQLVATAHGNALENVIKNPALNLLVGGIQSVTLGDDAAKRRGVQKSVLERAGPPTFDVCVEMIERHRWRVHSDVGLAVDAILAGGEPVAQMRERDTASGRVREIAFKGIIRRGNEKGEMQSYECWTTADGEEMVRPLVQTESRQALPVPQSSSATPGRAPASSASSSSSSTGNRAAGDSVPAARLGGMGVNRPMRPVVEDATPIRRPLPTMLAVPDPPLAPRPVLPSSQSAGTGRPISTPTPSNLAADLLSASVAIPELAPLQPPPESWAEEPKSPRLNSQQTPSSAEVTSSASAEAATSVSAAAAWPSAAAATASLPPLMPPPVLDTKNVAAAATAAAATAAAAAAAAVRPAASSPVHKEPEAAEEPAAPEPVPLLSRGPSAAPTSAMQVYLLMDDEHASKVQRVLAALADSTVVVLTQDLTAAHIVVATRSKLRSSPKMKSVVRKLGKPIYALRSSSSSSIYRELSPLLGITQEAAAVAASAATRSSLNDFESSGDSPADIEGGDGSEDAADSEARVAPLNGQGRADCTSADDYADLLDSMVRELRYQPIDREYSAQILNSFLTELAQSPPTEPGCSATSLATITWALAHTKHKRKFVDAKREALIALLAHCEGRWSEFSSRDLLRLALGVAGLRISPGAAWVEELAVRCKAGMAAGDYSVEQVERLSAAIYTLEALAEVSELVNT